MKWRQDGGETDLLGDDGKRLHGWVNCNNTAIVCGPSNWEGYDRRHFDDREEAKAWLIYACTFWELTREMPDKELWVWNGERQEQVST